MQCASLSLQDTQEFLRCLMDQLHEELKEPLTECNMSREGSDGEESRDGERSPSEEEFLSCDSGSSSGEGGGAGGGEPLLRDAFDGVRSPAGGVVDIGTGAVISEKERLKERRVSGSPLHGGSQEMDEDADVDTAVEEGAPERREEEEEVTPTTNTEVQSQEDNQLSDAGQEQEHSSSSSSSSTSGRPAGLKKGDSSTQHPWHATLLPRHFFSLVPRARQRGVNEPAPVHSLQPRANPSGAASQTVLQSTSLQPPPLCGASVRLQKR